MIDNKQKKKVLSYRWVIFSILALAYFLVYFHRTTGGAVSDEIKTLFGVDSAAVSLLAAAYLYSYTLMQLPSGLLTDTLGPRKAATIFIGVIGLGSLLSAYAAYVSDINLLTAGKFIIGIGAAVVYIPIMKVIAVWYRKYEFASLSGILLLVGNVGGIAAAYPMVAMCNSMGLQNTYIVLAILTFAVAVAAGLLVRNHPSEMQLPSIESIVAEETNKPVAESTSGSVPMVEALKRTFTSGRKFWPLAVWYFFTYGTIMLWQALQAGMYYRNVYGWDSTQFGLLLTLVGVGMVLGCPLDIFLIRFCAPEKRSSVLVQFAIQQYGPLSGLRQAILLLGVCRLLSIFASAFLAAFLWSVMRRSRNSFPSPWQVHLQQHSIFSPLLVVLSLQLWVAS